MRSQNRRQTPGLVPRNAARVNSDWWQGKPASAGLLDEPLLLIGLVDLLLLVDPPVPVLLDHGVQLVLVGAQLVQELVLGAEDVGNLRRVALDLRWVHVELEDV